jgi:eukaryotic-like serine/threonine-protein kinase
VMVNRRVVGVTPPLTQLSLPPGRHVVTITNDASPPYTLTVQVKSGQSLTVSHAF